jgi:hypothetical protein
MANSAAAVAQRALNNVAKKVRFYMIYYLFGTIFKRLIKYFSVILLFQQEILNHITNNLKKTPNSTPYLSAAAVESTTAYTAPDVSQFVYDETSGYYYDYTTGFYYDGTTQYFYNPNTQQYMYWDATASTYIPVATSTTPTVSSIGVDSEVTATAIIPEEKLDNNDIAESTVKLAASVNSKQTTTKTASQIAKVG